QGTCSAGCRQSKEGWLAGSVLNGAAIEVQRRDGDVVEVGGAVAGLDGVAEAQGVAARTGEVVEYAVGAASFEGQGRGTSDVHGAAELDGDDYGVADLVGAVGRAGRDASDRRGRGGGQRQIVAVAPGIAG